MGNERINPWTWGSISVSLAALWCFGKESLKAAIVFLYNTRHWTTLTSTNKLLPAFFLTNTKTAPQAERGPCWVFVCVIRSHRVSWRWRVWHKQHRCITQKAHIFYTYLKWSLIKVKKKLCAWSYPEHLPADVSNPVFFQTVSFGFLHQVCHRASATVLHH